MSDLVEFLLARIAEREAAARDRDYEWLTRHDSAMKPEVLLAECEAKRRIVERHTHDGFTCEEGLRAPAEAEWYETLRLLALPYANHPDYREEWRP